MNHAYAGLSLLRDAGIPVVTIEGNHDQKHNDSEYSWLRSLESWRLVHLLQPDNTDGKISYAPWDYERENYIRGGYIDIGRARIFGSNWYGASANWAIPMLTEAMKEQRREGAFHILLLHTDVEGHQTHPIPALSLANLKELKSVTDYVALGHTHKAYEIDNWAFNPGSLEITSIDEYRETRGAWLIEVGDDNRVNATHIRDYRQRPFQRIGFDVSGYAEAKDITDGVLAKVEGEARGFKDYAHGDGGDAIYKPIIEITLRGHLGFPNSLLQLKEIREKAQAMTDALHVRIKNHSAPIEYAVAADLEDDASREKLERRVIEDLIVRDNRFKTRVEDISDAVIGAKRMALSDDEPEKIADFIALKLDGELGTKEEEKATAQV
jgi:DNA repair exonuclease SbcCD nuclease subunit